MDREKVIKGLEDIQKHLDTKYSFAIRWNSKLILNAIALLKEQEHKDKMFHALEDDWKRLNELLKEQEARIEQLNRFVNGFSRDAVPVIRCKDCKYYDHFNGCMSWHDVNSGNDNWFCADGERQEGR